MFAWRNKRHADTEVYRYYSGEPLISGQDFLLLTWGLNPLCDRLSGPDIAEIDEAEGYVFRNLGVDCSDKKSAIEWLHLFVTAGIPMNRYWCAQFMDRAMKDAEAENDSWMTAEEIEERRLKKLKTPNLIWRSEITASKDNDALSTRYESPHPSEHKGNPELTSSESRHATHSPEQSLSRREETTYLNIIGALLDVIAGRCPTLPSHPQVNSEAALIDLLSEKYAGIPGLSKSNIQRKFPAAKRSLAAS